MHSVNLTTDLLPINIVYYLLVYSSDCF